VLVTVAVLALAAVGLGVWNGQRRKHHREFIASEVAAIEAFSAKLKVTFPTDLQPIQPDLIVFYPSLGTNLDKLAKGQLTPADATTQADAVATSAQKAATAISGLNVSQLIPAKFTVSGASNGASGTAAKDITAKGATQHELLDAQFLMAQSFQVWQQVGDLMKTTADATGAQRQALVDQTKQLAAKAASLFDRGYQKVLAIQNALGISTSSTGTQPIPIPSG